MKQYARFWCDHNMSYGYTMPDIGSSQPTLDELQREGWSVINTAIRIGRCAHSSDEYIFLLERDAVQAGDSRE